MLAWSDTGTAIVVAGGVIVVALILGRSLSGKIGSMEVKLGSIDRSVNHRPEGHSTISQDIAAMRQQMNDIVLPAIAQIPRIAERVGALEDQEDQR